MNEIMFTSELTAELVQHVGSDAMIAAAARVSTGADLAEVDAAKDRGLIGYLMRSRHGSCFEHGSMTFRIEAPIFVAREFMRHRVGWSYNETSARYREMEPKFYLYPEERPLVQAGSGAHPKLEHGDKAPYMNWQVNGATQRAYEVSWKMYQGMLSDGAANEVARTVLPVGLYTSFYATCNPRSLMHFLSLRVDDEANAFTTKPQWEIQRVAEQMEAEFAEHFPATHEAFRKSGRVSP